MPGPQLPPLDLTLDERRDLTALVRRHTAPQQLVLRAMSADHSWHISARRYVDLYRRARQAKLGRSTDIAEYQSITHPPRPTEE